MAYKPSKKILNKYADVLVNFALGGGKGVKKGDVVLIHVSECAKPLYAELQKAVWKAGGHVVGRYFPDNEPWHNFEKEFYLRANEEQLTFFPSKLYKGQIDTADHILRIDSRADHNALQGVDPKKILKARIAMKPYINWWHEKEDNGKLTWTIALYGTSVMAKESGLSTRQYWQQIIDACFLDRKNPKNDWRKILKSQQKFIEKLNRLNIKRLHVKGDDVDLMLRIGKERKWLGGGGANIPSFEIFTSPDWRGTEGWIKFNMPLYAYGHLIKGISLEFKNGKIIRSRAKSNEKTLKAIIRAPNADRLGEFSLTDRRFSRISKFMAETLYDENIGGPYGNTHVAIGRSFHECYKGDPRKVSKKKWSDLGYNDSTVHTDIISTTNRTVTAYLSNGRTKVIYKNGQFTI